MYYCTSTKFHWLFNLTIFADPEDVLNLSCVKYFELDINLQTLVSLACNSI